MQKSNLPQHNTDTLDLTEEMLDQITGSANESDDSYIVQKGDSLSAIAAKKCGSSDKWHKLYRKNKDVIGYNPNVINPGQKLNLNLD